MSLTTLLLAFLPAIVRPKPDEEKGPGLRWAREKRLEAERDALRDQLEQALVERDSWRRRYDESQAMLARVALDRLVQTPAEQQGHMLAQYAQAQAQQLAAQQQMANLSAYNQMQAAQGFCNCVPARHDMLLGVLGR